MRIGKWRVFRPRNTTPLFDPTAYETDTIYAKARVIVEEYMQKARQQGKGIEGTLARTKRAAKLLREHAQSDSASLLARLILQTPGAVRAQRSVDKQYGGYLKRQTRVFELIDFNDNFVDLVLSLDEKTLETFNERLRLEIDRFCQKVHAQTFSERELGAIIHGLSREIAVYHGARDEGYIARMTSRVQDSRGVDMIVTDPDSKKSVGIDIKTHSAFHWRLVRLARNQTITEDQLKGCESVGFCRIHNSRDKRSTTVLFRIDTRDDRLGEIKNYRFTNTRALGEKIARAIETQGQYMTSAI